MLHIARHEIWVERDGRKVPLALPGYGLTPEEAQRDADWRAARYIIESDGERDKLLFTPYRLVPPVAE